MLILGLESSAKAASAALSRDGVVLDMEFQNQGLTHSRTLLPMAETLLTRQSVALSQLDAVAVAQGPGSFTGIRIGISTAKGLCWGAEKPAIGVSTLEAMAWNAVDIAGDSIVCCAMDARRNQVYNALFSVSDSVPERLCKDRAIGLPELAGELKRAEKPVFVLGDGGELSYTFLKERGINAVLAPQPIRMQCAWGVCLAAQSRQPCSADLLLPVYLRLSQAERERLEHMKKE